MDKMHSRRHFLRTSAFVSGAVYGVSAGSFPLSWAVPEAHAAAAPEEEVLEIPTSTYRRRVANVQSELAKRDLGALVVVSLGPENWDVAWESRYLAKHSPGIVVVPAVGDSTLIAREPIAPRPRRVNTWIADVRWGLGPEGILDQCAGRLKELGLARGRIALAGDFRWAAELKLKDALPGARFQAGDDIQDQLRLIKDEYEIKFMKRAAEIADAEIRAAQLAIRPGRRMYEVVADALRERHLRGGVATDTLLYGYSSEGSILSKVSPIASRHQIVSGEAILYEPVVYYGHYNVETPVTFAVGKVSGDQKAIADLCFEAFEAGVQKLKPGVPVIEAVRSAHAVINPKGYPLFSNGPGHFIGIANIERPPIEQEPSIVLQPGMTISFHGTLVSPGKPQAWVGCCWLITDKGKEALTNLRLEPMIQL